MKTKYTKKQFLADVKAEAIALKKIATKGELQELDFEHLRPERANACIYGQMTGNCRSKRACTLITLCCKSYFRSTHDYSEEVETIANYLPLRISDAQKSKLNTPEGLMVTRERFSVGFLSAIESYILAEEAKNKNLIDFLQDKRKDLVL